MTGRHDNVISRLFTNPAWMRGAPCAGKTAIFFPEQHGNGPREAGEAAKAICATCDHRVRCLEFAIDNGEIHGFWGGTSPNDRRTITQNRRQMGWTTGRNRRILRCGTEPGYRGHLRNGEQPCVAYAQANRDASLYRRQAAKGDAA